MYGCSRDCLHLIPFWLLQISCFTYCLKCFSSDSDSSPDVGIGPLLQFSHPPRAGPVLVTLLFFPLVPSSYWVLHDSVYSYPLVRCSCLLSAGVLCAPLCLKVCSWCIHGEMYSTSTSSSTILFSLFLFSFWHMYICNFFFKFFFVFLNSTYFWLSFLHLHCCAWFSLVAASRDSFSLQCMSFTLW